MTLAFRLLAAAGTAIIIAYGVAKELPQSRVGQLVRPAYSPGVLLIGLALSVIGLAGGLLVGSLAM